jgi:hypothetical protein
MITIYTKHAGPRLQYTCNFIFEEFLGIPFQFSTESIPINQAYINYTETKESGGIFIKPSGLMSEEIPAREQLVPKWINQLPFLFHDGESDCLFDIFSAVFFCLSRYEEYNSYIPDQHGRFPAEESLAFRFNFLQIPVVDLWILRLKKILHQQFPELKCKERKFKFHSTIDIDNAYKYKGKNLLRLAGGGVKELLAGKANQLSRRLNYLIKKPTDPFDAYDFQIQTSYQFSTPLTYFVLFTFPGTYDNSLPANTKELPKLVQKLKASANVGIHPSYRSSERSYRMKEEIEMLSETIQKKIKISRQHFLRFKLPITFLQLEEFGIAEDYSMGYSTHNGFRAGTCTPFQFYNLAEEKQTSLRIIPFHIMDSVFYDQQGNSAANSMIEIKKIVDAAKSVNGELVSIWHDRSFDEIEFPGWRDAYLQLHQFCSE